MSDDVLELPLPTRGATRRLGRRLATCLRAGDLLVLEGDLGAGKTFLVRAIARGLEVPPEVRVTSPTFDLVHELPGRELLVHADLYRLDEPDSLTELGLFEHIGGDAVVLVEWGARFLEVLGPEGLLIELGLEAAGRHCRLKARGARGRALLSALRRELETRPISRPR
jgi:tRNA threonylcarbamoyladenosine biosynthesis protein TsaE